MIKVNTSIITEKEFDLACQEYRHQLKKSNLERKEFLAIANQLIDATLFLDDARKQGMMISDEEADTAFKSIEAQYSSPEELANLLKGAGESDHSFKEKLKNDLLLRKYLQDQFYSQVSVDDQVVEQVYQDNKDKFIAGEQVKASHILVQDEAKCRELHQELKAGGNFASLAQNHSTCPSGKSGGDLGFFGKGQMVPEFEAAAFSMAEGEVSEPVKTQFGYHLIKLVEKKASQAIDEAEARKMVQKQLAQQDVSVKMQEKVNQLREVASIELDQQLFDAKVAQKDSDKK